MRTVKQLSLDYFPLEYILQHIDNFEFETISINPIYQYHYKEELVLVEYTDLEHPIGIEKVGGAKTNGLYINKEYYIKHKEEIDKILIQIEKKLKGYIVLDGLELIDMNIVQNLVENKDVDEVLLRDKYEERYSLSKEMYEMIKKHENIKKIRSFKVDKELEENFDPLIDYNNRALFSTYHYRDLQTRKEISIRKFEEKDFENVKYLKYLNKDATIVLKQDNPQDLERFITELINNNILNKIKIEANVKSKQVFNSVVVPKLKNIPNIVTIIIDNDEYSLDKYLEYEDRLDKLVAPAMNLSPLERYLYAYNVVKKYKPYKENEDNLNDSRYVYRILDNQYMVCVGYSKLLEELLTRLGIQAYEFGVAVNSGFDGMDKDAQEIGDRLAKRAGHSRLQVKIEDPKYNVSGVYFADATWDNDMEQDLYTHALMTSDEFNSLKRENYIDNIRYNTTILESKTIQEFYDRVNYYLDINNKKEKELRKKTIIKNYEKVKEIDRDFLTLKVNEILAKDYQKGNSNFYVGELNRDLFVKKTVHSIAIDYFYDKMTPDKLEGFLRKKIDTNIVLVAEKNFNVEVRLLSEIIIYAERYNPTLYQDLKNKYPQAFKLSSPSTDTEEFIRQYSRVIEELAKYVTSVNNNKVQGKTILEALKEVYKVSNIENIDEKIEETRSINEKDYENAFPQRMKITDTSEVIYMNEENKFAGQKSL